MKRWFNLVCGLVLGLWVLPACQDDAPAPTATATGLTAVASPVRPGAELALNFPEEVLWGEAFGLTVTNRGNVPISLDVPEGENCLTLHTATGSLALTPDLTCDVLMVQILRPGESMFYGSWDLRICADALCVARGPAPEGDYFVEVHARLLDEAESIAQRAEFRLRGEAPAAAQTPRSAAGELVWLLTAELATAQTFSSELAPGATETIFLHMSGLGLEPPNPSSRQVVLTLNCEGPGTIDWFHEHFPAERGYPVRSARLGCGASDTVTFSFAANSQTVGLHLPAGTAGPVTFTLTATSPA